MRLRLTTSRPAGYRRGGQVLAGNDAPVIVTRDDLSPAQVLALLEDPNVAIAVSQDDEGDTFEPLSADEREAGIAATRSFLEAEAAKVDPSDPPTPDAAANGSAASGDAAADPAPAAEATKLQDPDGAEDKPEGAAASDEASEAKVAEVKDAAAVDPVRAEGAAAADSEQSRETAEAAASDRKAAAEEGSQPEATSRPPVAAPNSARRPGRNPKA